MDQAAAHCRAGIGRWGWASNEGDGDPDVVPFLPIVLPGIQLGMESPPLLPQIKDRVGAGAAASGVSRANRQDGHAAKLVAAAERMQSHGIIGISHDPAPCC